MVKALLNKGAKPNMTNAQFSAISIRVTPLMIAAQREYANIAQMLLSYGSDIKIRSSDGYPEDRLKTALTYAIEREHKGHSNTKVIQLLAGNGALTITSESERHTDSQILKKRAMAIGSDTYTTSTQRSVTLDPVYR